MSKKYLIVTLILVVVGVAGGFNAYNQSQTPQASDVALANIEALAGDGPSGEGGSSYVGPCAATYDPCSWFCDQAMSCACDGTYIKVDEVIDQGECVKN